MAGLNYELYGIEDSTLLTKDCSPFMKVSLKLLGVDSDNGGEFLNYFVYDWLKEKGIDQTRSRPYFKNDQAYVEQKNYTHVRGLLRYERLSHQELLS